MKHMMLTMTNDTLCCSRKSERKYLSKKEFVIQLKRNKSGERERDCLKDFLFLLWDLMLKRLWVQILVPYTGVTLHCLFEKTEIKEKKRPGLAHLKKV